MKFLIYLASRDDVAYRNYLTLSETRPNESTYVKITTLDFNIEQKSFFSKKNNFENIDLADKANVSVDFIAHGQSNTGNTLLIIPLHKFLAGENSVYTDIKPPYIAEYFKQNASESGQLKFGTLNLICCESRNFGLELSNLLQDVKVVCYDKDIYIKKVDPNSGIPHYINNKGEGIPAPQIVFQNGIDITPSQTNRSEQKDDNPPAEMLLRHQARIENINRPRSRSVESLSRESNRPVLLYPQTPPATSHSRLQKIPLPDTSQPEVENKSTSSIRKR